MINEKVRTGAYFYPNEPLCPSRMERAGGHSVASEPVLARRARSLFPGHDQPRDYCLGNRSLTDWDDSKPNVAQRHVELAQEAGLDFFIVDSYMGIRDGKKVQESGGFLSQISNLSPAQLGELSFGMMCCFRGPRTIFTISPGDLEKNREFDHSPETARYIVQQSAENYWDRPNYLRVGGRPYISFFVPGTGAAAEHSNDFRIFFDELKQYSWEKYGIDPYLVAVVSHKSPVQDASVLTKLGIDAVVGYSNILTFPQIEPVVNYNSLVDSRIEEWKHITNSVDKAVEPTAMVGLDASPRCVFTDSEGVALQPTTIEQLRPFIGRYPHSSIVIESSPESFITMLKKLIQLVANLPISDEEKIVTINAWNEMTEGSCMLPRIREDVVDWSYIYQTRSYLKKRVD